MTFVKFSVTAVLIPTILFLFYEFFRDVNSQADMPWWKSKGVVLLSAAGTAVGLTLLLKDYMGGGKFTNTIRADCKVVVITGANTGIGKETARALAKRGARVYMACRDMERCEEAREEIVLDTSNKYVYCRKCDLASLQSIRDFANGFKKEQDHIDILINNAGVMRCPLLRTKEGFEMQLGTNHMGHFLLTHLLMDHLKAAPSCRIVNVSSLAHARGKINIEDLNSDCKYDSGAAYSQSKLANVMFTRELAKRLDDTSVTVNALHPGVVKTELGRHMTIFKNPFFYYLFAPFAWVLMKTSEQGAQTSIHCALHPNLEGVTGKYFSDCAEKDVAAQAKDENVSDWLWKTSECWTGLDGGKDQLEKKDGKKKDGKKKDGKKKDGKEEDGEKEDIEEEGTEKGDDGEKDKCQ